MIRIVSKHGEIIGTVYYRSIEQISIKPNGLSNKLYTFEFEPSDEEEIYKESDGVTEVNIIKKREAESFVAQQSFYVGQVIDAFADNAHKVRSYKIKEVNAENDFIIVTEYHGEEEQEQEQEENITFEFNYTGIPIEFDFVNILPGTQPIVPERVDVEEIDDRNVEYTEEPEEEVTFFGTYTVVIPKVYREAKAYEQFIPDNLQKIDAFNDLTADLDDKAKRSPNTLRNIRILLETLFQLKHETVAYHSDGRPRKTMKTISATTLTSLIENTAVPLGRPILDVRKKLYVANEENLEDVENADTKEDVYCEQFNYERDAMIELNESEVALNDRSNEWNKQRKYLKEYATPWIKKDDDDGWTAIADSDFFRGVPADKDISDPEIYGYLPSHSLEDPPIVDKIMFGSERALSTTFRKGDKDGRSKEVLLTEEKAPVVTYLLFPVSTGPYLGAIRSNHLALDSGMSRLLRTTMKTLIKELGNPVEGGTSQNIQQFDLSGETIGNIQVSDYINGISIKSLTIHDVFYTLLQFGMDKLELSIDLFEVLKKKIDRTQTHFIHTLNEFRKKIEAVEQQPNNFIEQSLIEQLKKQEILAKEIERYERCNPTLAQSDLGVISHMLKKHSNFMQVAVGNNSLLIAKAIHNTMRTLNLEHERNKKAEKDNSHYVRPVPNKCKHVTTLNTIRKKHDDTERFQLLTAFLKKFQGLRNENWVECSMCEEHLLCIHERLQIQGFLQPTEKLSIDKEIILKCAGGQFQGKFICRNCGQPIREFEFDNTMEFDDEGRPKSGNAVLVDDAADMEAKINMLISPSLEKTDKNPLLRNDKEITYYGVIREMALQMHVEFTTVQIRRMLDRISAYVAENATKKAHKKQGDKALTFDQFESQITIYTCAVFVLIEIQCAIPAFRDQYVIGKNTYSIHGFPLSTDPEDKQSIKYLSIILYYCYRHKRTTSPWRSLKIFEDDTKRLTAMDQIADILFDVTSDVILTPIIQEYLIAKRRQGPIKRLEEQIPVSFLPQQADTLDQTVVVAEVAQMNSNNKTAVAQAWIQAGHQIAKESAKLDYSSLFAETTCCHKDIVDPGWDTSQLPEIGMRGLVPKQMNMLVTTFIPREAQADIIKPDAELFFRLFLKCCADGPNKGKSHKCGVTNKCIWCGVQFPENIKILDTDKTESDKMAQEADQKAKEALAGITINSGTFSTLLDKIHSNNEVDDITLQRVTPLDKVVDEFTHLTFSFMDEWQEVLATMFTGLATLPPGSANEDAAMYLATISDMARERKQVVEGMFKGRDLFIKICNYISELPWANFCNVLTLYFIVPMQRVISNFSVLDLKVPIELLNELSAMHVEKYIEPMLETELEFYNNFTIDGQIEEALSRVAAKATINEVMIEANKDLLIQQMAQCIAELSAFIQYKTKLSFRNIYGATMVQSYIKQLVLYGTIFSLLHSGNDVINVIMTKFIMEQLQKCRTELLPFNEDLIRNRLESRNEKERTGIIQEMNKMDEDVRKIEVMKKRLGIGKWAVGGTKLIRVYDKDYFDLEDSKRTAAGIIDVSGLGEDIIPGGLDPEVEQEEHEVDDLGFAVDNEDSAYDIAEANDDD